MSDLKPDKHNANQGTERGKNLLEQSLTELGGGRSILVDKDGNVIAGNKTLEAAQKKGLTIRIVDAERNELVAVRRRDMDLEEAGGEARRMAYLDNRVSELDLNWDAERIAADAQAGLDFDGVGFLDKELQKLLVEAELNRSSLEDPGAEMDKAEELRAKWGVERGQVWKLGVHSLAVGDCLNPELTAKIMQGDPATLCWTDPPWNVNYGAVEKDNVQGYRVRKIANDNLGDAFPDFVRGFVKMIWDACMPGAVIYLVMSAQEWPTVDAILRERNFHWSSTIIWVKDQHVLSRKDYHTQYEPLWYGWKADAARLREVMDRKQSDVWMIERPKKSEEHPIMKPLELVERSLINSSLPNDVVLDPFCGSGTTIIACERLGRRCRAIEIEPGYAAVALERWAIMTGEIPIIELRD